MTTIRPLKLTSNADQSALDYGNPPIRCLSAYSGAQTPGAGRIVVTVGPITPPDNSTFMLTAPHGSDGAGDSAALAGGGPAAATAAGSAVPSRICVKDGSCTVDPCFGGPPPPPPKTVQAVTAASGVVTDLVFPTGGLDFYKRTIQLAGDTLGPVVILDRKVTSTLLAVRTALETWFDTFATSEPGDLFHFHIYRVVTVTGTGEIAPGDCLAIPVIPTDLAVHGDGDKAMAAPAESPPPPPAVVVEPFTLYIPDDESELDYGDTAAPATISAHTDAQRPGPDRFVLRVGPITANQAPPASGTSVPSRVCVVRGTCSVDPCFDSPPPPPPTKKPSLGNDPPPLEPVTDLQVSTIGLEVGDGLRWPGLGPVLRIPAAASPTFDRVRAWMNAWVNDNDLLDGAFHFHVYRVVEIDGGTQLAPGDCVAIPIVLPDDLARP